MIPDLVIGRWYRFRTTSLVYEGLTRIGELVDVSKHADHGRVCRLQGRGNGPVYVVPERQVIAELRLEDVL